MLIHARFGTKSEIRCNCDSETDLDGEKFSFEVYGGLLLVRCLNCHETYSASELVSATQNIAVKMLSDGRLVSAPRKGT